MSDELPDLRQRVERLESLAAGVVRLATIVLLAVALAVPYFYDRDSTDGTKDVTERLSTIPFHAFGYHNDSGNSDGVAVFFGICFAGLLVLIVLAMLTALTGLASASSPRRRVDTAVAILLFIGCVGAALFMSPTLLDRSEDDPGYGVVFLAAGSVAFLALVFGPVAAMARPRRPDLSSPATARPADVSD